MNQFELTVKRETLRVELEGKQKAALIQGLAQTIFAGRMASIDMMGAVSEKSTSHKEMVRTSFLAAEAFVIEQLRRDPNHFKIPDHAIAEVMGRMGQKMGDSLTESGEKVWNSCIEFLSSITPDQMPKITASDALTHAQKTSLVDMISILRTGR